MMLHVRDCPGTTSTFDVCPFPWCRKVKHLLYHLVSCTQPKQCAICSPSNLTKEMQGLVGLNKHRLKRQRERMIAAIRSNNATRQQQRASQYSQVQPAKSSSSLPKKPFPQIGSAPSKPKATTARSTAVTKPRPNVQNLQTNYSLASKPSTAAQVQPSSAGTQKDVSPSASDPAKSNIIAPSTVKIEPQGIAQQNKTPVHVNVAPASVVQNPIPMDGSPEEKSTSKSVGNHGQSSAEIGPEVATKKENTITVSAKNRSTTGGQSTTNTDAITTFEAAPEATKEIRNTHESKVKIETVAGLANESGGTNEATPSLETNQEEDRTQGDGKTGETRQTTLSDTKLDETNFSSAAVKQEEDEIPQRNQSIAAGDAAKDTSNSSVTPSESEICRSDSSSKADQTSHSEKTVTQVRVA